MYKYDHVYTVYTICFMMLDATPADAQGFCFKQNTFYLLFFLFKAQV